MTFVYKFDRAPPLVENVFREMGWMEWDEELHKPDEWNILWKPSR